MKSRPSQRFIPSNDPNLKSASDNSEGTGRLNTLVDISSDMEQGPGARRTGPSEASTPTRLWYALSVIFGLLGGVVAYFATKDEDQAMANRCLWTGLIVSVLFLLVVIGPMFLG